MSNYNSTHTGAELDEAIGRVIDGGSIKVQTDTNTADITSLKGRMTTAEGVMADMATKLGSAEEAIDDLNVGLSEEELVSKTNSFAYAKGSGGVVIADGGVGIKTITVTGVNGVYFRITAKNNGSDVTLYPYSTPDTDSVTIANPYPDYDLKDIKVYVASSSAIGITNGLLTILKLNPLYKVRDGVTANSNSIAGLDSVDYTNTAMIPLCLSKTASVVILQYLGKRDASVTIYGCNGCGITVTSNNRGTGSSVQWYSGTLSEDSFTINNPRTDLELINITIRCNSGSSISACGWYSLTKKNPIAEIVNDSATILAHTTQINDMSKTIVSLDSLQQVETSDIPISVSIGGNIPILSYLGKMNCSVTLHGVAGSSIAVKAQNKATNNWVTWYQSASDETADELTVNNNRLDLELINITVFCLSASSNAYDGTYSIRKDNYISNIHGIAEQTKTNAMEIEGVDSKVFWLDTSQTISASSVVNIEKNGYLEIYANLDHETTIKVEGCNGAKISVWGTHVGGANVSFNYELSGGSTGNGWIDVPTSVMFTNPHPEWEWVDVRLRVGSTSSVALVNAKVTVTKPNALLHDDYMHESKSQFGYIATFDYTQPTLPDMPPRPAVGTALAYFYGLYDALVSAYPNYITKIDLDTEALSAIDGLVRPAAMASCPLYAYNFIPPTPPNNSPINTTTTDVTPIKIMILSGTHPEYLCITDLYYMMKAICEEWSSSTDLEELRWNVQLYIMPCSGAWCVENWSRANYNGVDLARNSPTIGWTESGQGTNTWSGPSAGSEYETKVLGYYLDVVKPDIFIDHHNTGASSSADPGDNKNMMYFHCTSQEVIDIAGDVIRLSTRKWKVRYNTLFPNVETDNTMFGYTRWTLYNQDRCTWALEKGARLTCTAESNRNIIYSNGVIDWANKQEYSSTVLTCAVEWMVNFVTRLAQDILFMTKDK